MSKVTDERTVTSNLDEAKSLVINKQLITKSRLKIVLDNRIKINKNIN